MEQLCRGSVSSRYVVYMSDIGLPSRILDLDRA